MVPGTTRKTKARRGIKEKGSVIMTIASLVATGVLDWEGLELVRKVRSQCYLLGQEAGVGVHVFFCLRMKSLSDQGNKIRVR